jgi:inner membrane protein
MDSLAQIVLGAAVGEAVLGKKIGNRAMLWGAIGGTIPDLDVLGGMFLNDLDNLAFHRGFSHSIFFGIIGAFVFGWLVHWLYRQKFHKQIAIISKLLALGLVIAALNFVLRIFFPGNYLPLLICGVVLLALMLYHIKLRYFSDKWKAPVASRKDWQWLFFWSLFTHPLLDCFTTYGTQLFNPISDYRVAFNTVSVVDFGYTLPFLICVIVAACNLRASRKRRLWNRAGLVVSCAFLLFTVINKFYIGNQFEKAYAKQEIPVNRYTTSPTILNNILWSATLETDSLFYLGQYSWFDEVPITFNSVKKGHDLIDNLDTDPTLKKLRWFSKDYFCIMDIDSALQYNDLRFGTFYGKGDSPDDYIFNFHLRKLANGIYEMKNGRQGPKKGGASNLFGDLMKRIGGLKKS